MATEKLREARDWLNLGFTIISVMVVPVGLLVLRNQKLEIQQDMAQKYVPLDLYKEARAADTANAAAMNAKIDRLNTSVTRLTDAVKLKDQQP